MVDDIIKPELLDQSILFARFASAAYLDADPRTVGFDRRLTCDKRVNEENSENKTDTQALICKWNKDVVIAFRGTEGKFSDWLTDLKGKLVPNSDGVGRIHEGFKSAADSVHSHIADYIPKIADPKSRLFVCGHSLGGALALMFAERLAKKTNMPKIAGVFTYGAPRVGDEKYVADYRKISVAQTTHMWVHPQDPVARVAPHSFEYRHAINKQFTFDQAGEIRHTDLDLLDEHEKETSFLADVVSVYSRLKNAIQSFDASKHSINDSYLKQLLDAKTRA